jgi:hypothetical protein
LSEAKLGMHGSDVYKHCVGLSRQLLQNGVAPLH